VESKETFVVSVGLKPTKEQQQKKNVPTKVHQQIMAESNR